MFWWKIAHRCYSDKSKTNKQISHYYNCGLCFFLCLVMTLWHYCHVGMVNCNICVKSCFSWNLYWTNSTLRNEKLLSCQTCSLKWKCKAQKSPRKNPESPKNIWQYSWTCLPLGHFEPRVPFLLMRLKNHHRCFKV